MFILLSFSGVKEVIKANTGINNGRIIRLVSVGRISTLKFELQILSFGTSLFIQLNNLIVDVS